MTIVNVDGKIFYFKFKSNKYIFIWLDSLKNLLNDLKVNLTEEDPQSRPTWSILLKTQLFQ